MKSKRKYALLKQEIKDIQRILLDEVHFIPEYVDKLVQNLENLKKEWYKSK